MNTHVNILLKCTKVPVLKCVGRLNVPTTNAIVTEVKFEQH